MSELIIVPDESSRKVIQSLTNQRNSIILTVDEILNEEYKNYKFDNFKFHQYALVKEKVEATGKKIESLLAELVLSIAENAEELIIDNLKFTKVISHRTIQTKIKDYKGIEPDIILGILNGCQPFLSDLIKVMDKKDIIVDYCQLSSYKGGLSGGELEIIIEPSYELYEGNKTVYIVDDILASGKTIEKVIELLTDYNPDLDIKVLTLLRNPESPKEISSYPVDSLFTIDGFVVGYGLDYKEMYRGLPDIYSLKEELSKQEVDRSLDSED